MRNLIGRLLIKAGQKIQKEKQKIHYISNAKVITGGHSIGIRNEYLDMEKDNQIVRLYCQIGTKSERDVLKPNCVIDVWFYDNGLIKDYKLAIEHEVA